AELAGIEREWQALIRDREARAKQAASKHGLPAALDKVSAAPGYERALAAQVRDCPPQLAARLALVHVADADDGRALKPGEWLVTLGGRLRRWDGFVARGEGAAEAARLEAENRFAELDAALPSRREAATRAEEAQRD